MKLQGLVLALSLLFASCGSGGKLDPPPWPAPASGQAAYLQRDDQRQGDGLPGAEPPAPEFSELRQRLDHRPGVRQLIGFGCFSVNRDSWNEALDQLEEFYRATPPPQGFGYSLGYTMGYVCASQNHTVECAQTCARHFQTNHMPRARQRFKDFLGVPI